MEFDGIELTLKKRVLLVHATNEMQIKILSSNAFHLLLMKLFHSPIN